MRTCSACGGSARKLQRALILAGPNTLRRGKVCGDCARLGWLLVLGADAVECDGTSLRGRVATLIARDFFQEPRTNSATRRELKRTGPDCNDGSLSRELAKLVAWGLLTHESGGFQVAPNAKIRLRNANGSSARA